MHTDKRITKILFDKETIQNRIIEIAKWVDENYKDKQLVFIAILKGASVFLMDLIKHIKTDHVIDFIIAKSYYGGVKSSGSVKIIADIDYDIADKDVILVDDILDSGITTFEIQKHLLVKKPNSVKIMTLFNKQPKRQFDISADIVGFEVPDAFLVGYGLDYEDKYRNWPFVAIFDPEKK
ncbi:hypoxanthine phosphoribosyltransferase [Mesomycoplasma conjunctivae]|uniref:hypoxanthine phosphoribosyltransferase n=1 Tax=Mesomycoplasma conjunctivae TaxID=45361 RepID=UPI003DA56C12